MPGVGRIVYDAAAGPLQVFTPLREEVLRITQQGPVYRVVIVFRVLGAQYFWPDRTFADYAVDYPFFSASELSGLFATDDTAALTEQLMGAWRRRYVPRPTADGLKGIGHAPTLSGVPAREVGVRPLVAALGVEIVR